MLKNHSISSSATIRLGDVVERGVGERDEEHGEAGAHRLARLRMTEHDPASVGDAVDRALATGCQLHHEELGAVLGGEQLDRFLEPHRHRPGPFVQQLVGPVDRGVEDPEAREPLEKTGLKQTGRSGYPSSRAADATAAAPWTRRNAGAGTPSR